MVAKVAKLVLFAHKVKKERRLHVCNKRVCDLSPHKLRKIRKKRGTRTCGYGQVGQHRESGSQGYRKGGFDKHAKTYVLKYMPNYFTYRGFTSPRSLLHKDNVINVGKLEEVIEKLSIENKMKNKDGKVFLDLVELGYDKLLATGRVSKPIIVNITSYSEGAAKKIEEAGGKIQAKIVQATNKN